jgi:hypothetical protein
VGDPTLLEWKTGVFYNEEIFKETIEEVTIGL